MADLFRKVAIGTYDMIPEGSLKHTLRSVASKFNGELSKRAYVNRGDVAVQVGTPSTGTVRYLLELVGPTGRVVVIEPEEANFRKLAEDTVIASAGNIVLLNKGAWSRCGKLALTVSRDKADHKIAVDGIIHDNDLVPENYVGVQMIPVDTLDNMLNEADSPRVDFMEIMVNGAELEVLKGMDTLLDQGVRLRIKAHAKDANTGADIGQEIIKLLKEKGYRTVRARQTIARTEATEWGTRAGDIYAAKR